LDLILNLLRSRHEG